MRFIFVLTMLVSFSCFGQYKNFIIGPKGDTLDRVDLNGKKQGPWVIHVDDNHGERGYEEEGYFLNDKRDNEKNKKKKKRKEKKEEQRPANIKLNKIIRFEVQQGPNATQQLA